VLDWSPRTSQKGSASHGHERGVSRSFHIRTRKRAYTVRFYAVILASKRSASELRHFRLYVQRGQGGVVALVRYFHT